MDKVTNFPTFETLEISEFWLTFVQELVHTDLFLVLHEGPWPPGFSLPCSW